MPVWVQWVTFVVAVCGLGLGVFNAVLSCGRGAVRFRVEGEIKQRRSDGRLGFFVKVVNTGRIPITVEKVFLTRFRMRKPKRFELRSDAVGREPPLPFRLDGGEARAIPISFEALREPIVREAFTVVAQTQDGRQVKRRCPALRARAARVATSVRPPAIPHPRTAR